MKATGLLSCSLFLQSHTYSFRDPDATHTDTWATVFNLSWSDLKKVDDGAYRSFQGNPKGRTFSTRPGTVVLEKHNRVRQAVAAATRYSGVTTTAQGITTTAYNILIHQFECVLKND
jgi:hypothetical protein